ncbi:MAG: PorT family protein [Chryseobacterium sp.]|nr:MAG: PorT family protein [Chryseobacterium sp.]
MAVRGKFIGLLFTAGSCALSAQFRTVERMDHLEQFDEKKFSWGFFLNANRYNEKLVLDPKYGYNDGQDLVHYKSAYSFGAGLLGKMRINDNLDLRLEPGLQFVQRELFFNTQSNDQYAVDANGDDVFTPLPLGPADKHRNLKSTYIDIPLLLEVHGDRWYNSRPYIAGGLNWMVNLQSNADSEDDNAQGIFRSTSSNFGWSAEMGLQLYFNRFKLTPAIRGTFVFNNEVVPDKSSTPPYWASAIANMHTRAFMFVLKFE